MSLLFLVRSASEVRRKVNISLKNPGGSFDFYRKLPKTPSQDLSGLRGKPN